MRTDPERSVHPSGSPPDRRVIVVDDEPEIRLLLGTFLRRSGWDCRVATEPAEVLSTLERWPASHALIDLHLELHSGLDLIRTLSRAKPDMRIVAMTGSLTSGREAALSMGAHAFLSKPFGRLKEVSRALEGAAP